jgi:small subunit ribosomal protein S2
MLTNFATIRKAVKKMSSIDKMLTDVSFTSISKRERLQISREREKLERNLGSIADLSRLPAALFIVDIHKEHIAVAEAKRLNIPTFAIVDTNSNPNDVDYAIPANDDAAKSIELLLKHVVASIQEGLSERKHDKEQSNEDEGSSEKQYEVRIDDEDDKGAPKGAGAAKKVGVRRGAKAKVN